MTRAVVQAKCPHCTKDLRIPAEWVHTALRCKHCRNLLQARPRATPPVATVVPPPATLEVPLDVPDPVPLVTPVAYSLFDDASRLPSARHLQKRWNDLVERARARLAASTNGNGRVRGTR